MEDTKDACRLFKARGGDVLHMTALQTFTFYVGDRVAPVCDAGVNRSQIAYVAASAKLPGCTVLPPHGIFAGFDPKQTRKHKPINMVAADKKAAFAAAFGVDRVPKMGEYEAGDAAAYFNSFFAQLTAPPRTVVISFGHAATTAWIERLVSTCEPWGADAVFHVVVLQYDWVDNTLDCTGADLSTAYSTLYADLIRTWNMSSVPSSVCTQPADGGANEDAVWCTNTSSVHVGMCKISV